MSTNITLAEKQSFIKWVLANYEFKRRECAWVLNYLLSHDNVLRRTHFIDEGFKFVDRGLLLTTKCADSAPLRLRINSLTNSSDTSDADEIFNSLRYSQSDLYVYVNFSGKNGIEYQSIVEENTFMPESAKANTAQSREVDKLFGKILAEGELKRAEEAVDKALILGDQEAFMRNASLYKIAKERYNRKYVNS